MFLLDSLSVLLDWFTADLVKKSFIDPCLLLCCESSRIAVKMTAAHLFFVLFCKLQVGCMLFPFESSALNAVLKQKPQSLQLGFPFLTGYIWL